MEHCFRWSITISCRLGKSQRHITLVPRPVPPTSRAVTTEVLVLVYWANTPLTEVAWSNLVGAFEAFFATDYSGAIIPANVAVESRLAPLVERYLARKIGISPTRLRDLRKDLTYSIHLDILLPTLIQLCNAPAITKIILDNLRTLKSLRNDLAHRGTSERSLDRDQVAIYLAAAVLAFGYLGVLAAAWFPQAPEAC
jgi:hypothetical protein